MTGPCNYDMPSDSLSNSDKSISDCYQDCIDLGCDSSLLANNECDKSCNIAECGWDWGDCGYCAQYCTQEKLNSGCDSSCKNELCYFNAGGCVRSI